MLYSIGAFGVKKDERLLRKFRAMPAVIFSLNSLYVAQRSHKAKIRTFC